MELTSRRTGGSDLRGFLSTRRGAIAVAVACAIAAAAVLLIAISRYRASVSSSQQAITVLVANQLIPKGTSGTAIATGGYFTPERLVRKQAVGNAVSNTGAISGQVATRDLLPGQQLTTADFVPASGIAAELGPSQRAISLTLDQAHGLGGLIQAGDHVDVYGGFNVDQGGGPMRPVMRLLMPNVRVLQANVGGGGIGGSQGSTTVLAVGEQQAAGMAFAQEYGKIWLTMRGNGAASTKPIFMNLYAELLGLTPVQNDAFNRSIVNPLVARGSQ